MKTAGRFLSAVIITILSSSAALYLAEGYLRHFYHPVTLIAPFYSFGESVAGAHIRAIQREYDIEMDFNSQGFREKEFTPEKGSRKRILFLGDSFVEGAGVNVEKRASNLLENMLNERRTSSGYEVLNAGMSATDPIHYFQNLTSFGLALQPDMVVVGVFIGNDFINGRLHPVPKEYRVEDSSRPFETRLPPFAELGYLRQLVKQAITHKTALVKNYRTDRIWEFFLRRRISREWFNKVSGLPRDEFGKRINRINLGLVNEFISGRINPSYLVISLQQPDKEADPAQPYYAPEDVETVSRVIKEMHRLCADRHIRFIVVIYPDIYQVMKEKYRAHLMNTLGMPRVPRQLLELESLQKKFMSSLRRANIQCIDLSNRLTDRDYYLFDGHLNEHGYAVAAAAMRGPVAASFEERN